MNIWWSIVHQIKSTTQSFLGFLVLLLIEMGILRELLPSSPLKKVMKIAVLCKKGDYISSLSSLELLSLIPHTGLNSFVIYSQGSIQLTFDIHPTGEHYLKLVLS